ncbi:hypothetical protein B8V81_1344 [Paenibacillus pasadenensis]|uniref:Uncharacterized protein n=1 Tax=Paenibacillus pasadenensis TaxID=217090 RepID=A0A2N5NA11_9BACL|nr:hypothetical protein B8V81_1344 [Paenibacillus pasadenensis]
MKNGASTDEVDIFTGPVFGKRNLNPLICISCGYTNWEEGDIIEPSNTKG